MHRELPGLPAASPRLSHDRRSLTCWMGSRNGTLNSTDASAAIVTKQARPHRAAAWPATGPGVGARSTDIMI